MPGSRMPEGLELARMWHGVVGHLQVEVAGPTFATWIEGTRPLRVEDDTLVVEARSAFICDSLNEHPLRTMVRRALHATTGGPGDVRFVPPGASRAATPPLSSPEQCASKVIGTLNTRFTFATYVPTDGNALASQACRDIFEEPDYAVNLIVFHGPPGVGKTHLLHAVGTLAGRDGVPSACLSAEEFANRFVAAVRDRKVELFQAAMRPLRLLLIDDLQYLEGRSGTQNELVHTIEAIVNAGGHVVLASERDPRQLNLLPRLVSRLAGGLVSAIEPPLPAERRCVIDHIARQHRTALPGWCVDRLATLPAPSVRVIQGAVNAAIALHRSDRLTLEALDVAVLATTLHDASARRDASTVIERVARIFEVAVADIAGRSRKPVLTEARAVAVAALRQRGETFTDIGNRLGSRSTATLKDLNKRGTKLIEARADLRQALAG